MVFSSRDSLVSLSLSRRLSKRISSCVKARVGDELGSERFIMVIQKTRQLRMQNTEIKLTSRSAVLSFDSSALQPDFKILWNTSIFHRMAYHSSFSIAFLRE